MKKEKSLKREILVILISFSIFIAIGVGFIAMLNFYFSKLNIIEHNQKQILYQIESEMDKFLSKIYKISSYIKNNYNQDSNLLKNIVDTNTNISSILVLSKDGIIEDFYATTNLNIYKGFDYSKQTFSPDVKRIYILGKSEDENRFELQKKSILKYQQETGHERNVIMLEAGHIVPTDAPDAYVKVLKQLL
jgi:hypothetical protein